MEYQKIKLLRYNKITNSGITLTNRIKCIINVIKSLENRGILLKETTRKMSPHPLPNTEIQKYYQNEPKFNGVIQEIIYLK